MRSLTLMNRVWFEVTNRHPCPICGEGHRNQGWCLVSEDGYDAICPRTTSDRPIGNAGYLHVLREEPRQGAFRRVPRQVTPATPKMSPDQVRAVYRQCRAQFTGRKSFPLATALGLGSGCLKAIGTGYEGRGWYTFPMILDSEIVGLRRRHLDGTMRSLKNTRAGLFQPLKLAGQRRIYIVEGPTDLAAAVQIGLNAIGRPQCFGFEQAVLDKLRQLQATSAVVIRDLGRKDSRLSKDNSYKGAADLVRFLARHGFDAQMFTPPVGRDLRDSVIWGLLAKDVERAAEQHARKLAR